MAGDLMIGGAFTHGNTIAPKQEKVLSLFSCKGKSVIVSGAGAGIGLAVAHALAEEGAHVTIWYKTSKVATERASEIEKEYGVKCRAYQVDIPKEEEVEKSVSAAIRDLGGRLDIFVANAGTFPEEAGPILVFMFAEWVLIIDIGRSLAVEWIQFARINSVSPGIFDTPTTEQLTEESRNMWKDNVLMVPEGTTNELKGTYLYLCSDASSYTTGTEFVVDGGRSLL
ncbi:hypothetical protein MMC30_007254 [Trapelia coarctata]|nr:hypothetical protein [Trapelia coarctata]